MAVVVVESSPISKKPVLRFPETLSAPDIVPFPVALKLPVTAAPLVVSAILSSEALVPSTRVPLLPYTSGEVVPLPLLVSAIE